MRGTGSLNRGQWRLLLEVYDEATSLPAGERDGFLQSKLGHRPDLLEEAASLLASHDADPGFLEKPAARLTDASPEAPAVEEPETIGPYRVVRRIGVGGMGAVYLAERDDDQFRQRVAIKLLKRGMDSEQILARFRAERQILAGLEHPGIARLLDGGVAADGRPYFVLEHVAGSKPIDRYCDDQKLGIRDRIELFRRACDAVQFAHRKLIVHRDLKPSNLLVSSEGEIKLVDFGIAKLLDPVAADVTRPALTHTLLRPMTPEYASPEQVRGEPLSTTSDVYSLGVILYRLLTGRLPYRLPETSPMAMAEAIRRERPERPSTAAATPEPPRTAGQPAFPSSRRLAADLDNIVLMALAKEPEARYASAEALAADLGRFLERRPVRARPQTTGYRLRRFVERHALAVSLAGLAAVSLLAGIAGTIWQAREARVERDRARAEARKAERVADVLVELFESSDPGLESDALSMTVREFADRAEENLGSGLAGQPEVLARLETVMGRLNINLARHDAARRLLASALSRQRLLFPEGDLDLAETLRWYSVALRALGEPEAADAASLEALEMRRRLLETDDVGVATLLLQRAPALPRDEAEQAVSRALAIYRRELPEGDSRIGDGLSSVAVLDYRRGDYAEAIAQSRAALAIQEEHHGLRHQAVAHELNNLGAYLMAHGDYEHAAEVHRRALATRAAVWGEEHPFVAFSLIHLGRLALLLDDAEEARDRFQRALDLRVSAYGRDHPLVGGARVALGSAWTALDEPSRAIPLLEEAVAIFRGLERRPDRLAAALVELGHGRRAAGDGSGAQAAYREALELRLETHGAAHPRTARAQAALGRVLFEAGRPAEAEPLLTAALASYAEAFPEGHLDAVPAHLALGDLERKRRRSAEAEAAYGEALRVLEARLPVGHRRVAEARDRLEGLKSGAG